MGMKGRGDIATHGAVLGIAQEEVTQGRVWGMMMICCSGTSRMASHGECDGCTCDACLATPSLAEADPAPYQHINIHGAPDSLTVFHSAQQTQDT